MTPTIPSHPIPTSATSSTSSGTLSPLIILILVLFGLMVTVQVVGWVSQLGMFLHQYFGLRDPTDLKGVYSRAVDDGIDSTRSEHTKDTTNDTNDTNTPPSAPWVVITGGSSGQGREFAIQFAHQGFGIVLIGSQRSHATAELVRAKGVPCKVIVKDLGRAFEPGFFEDIRTVLEPLDCAILVNNVGHRTGWMPFHESPERSLDETIACGTIVQTRMTHMVLPKLLKRLDTGSSSSSSPSSPPSTRSAILFITAQCMHPNTGFAVPGFIDNAISVPYLATYEASNAFGYYHACSLIQEYAHVDRLDLLNITPGAVITENTAHVLRDAPFAVSAETFVSNILRFLGGNVANGTTCAHWGHALSNALVGFAPWKKDEWLRRVGESIASDYMGRYRDRVERYTGGDEPKGVDGDEDVVVKEAFEGVE